MDSQKIHKKEKPLFRWPSGQSGCWATMSAGVSLVLIHFLLATYVKEILSRSTNTDAGEMITPAQEKRNTSCIGAWPNSLDILYSTSSVKKNLLNSPIHSDQGADSIFKITLNILCFACALALLRYDDKRQWQYLLTAWEKALIKLNAASLLFHVNMITIRRTYVIFWQAGLQASLRRFHDNNR